MASNINPNIPVTGADNSTQSIRDNFRQMKEEIEALQTGQKYKRVLFAVGYPGTDMDGYHGPRGPHPRGTLWFSSDYGLLSIWLGGAADVSAIHWHDVKNLT